jgi:probable rRNA maturation factor
MSSLALDLQFGDFPDAARHRAILRTPRVKRWMAMALLHPAEITVRIVGQEEGRALNLQ